MPLGPRCGWTDRGLARVQQAQAGHHSRLAKALHACRRTKLGKQNSDFSIVHSIIFQELVIDIGIEPWLQRIWQTKKRFEMVMEGEDLQKGWILCCFANFHIFVGSGWNKIRQLFHWAKPRRFELNEYHYAKKSLNLKAPYSYHLPSCSEYYLIPFVKMLWVTVSDQAPMLQLPWYHYLCEKKLVYEGLINCGKLDIQLQRTLMAWFMMITCKPYY